MGSEEVVNLLNRFVDMHNLFCALNYTSVKETMENVFKYISSAVHLLEEKKKKNWGQLF